MLRVWLASCPLRHTIHPTTDLAIGGKFTGYYGEDRQWMHFDGLASLLVASARSSVG